MMAEESNSESEWSTLSTPRTTSPTIGEADDTISTRAATPIASTVIPDTYSDHSQSIIDPAVKVDVSHDGNTCMVTVAQNANIRGFTLTYSPDNSTQGWSTTLRLTDEKVEQVKAENLSTKRKNKFQHMRKKNYSPKWNPRNDFAWIGIPGIPGFAEEFKRNPNEVLGKSRVDRMMETLVGIGKVTINVKVKRNYWIRFLDNLNPAAINKIEKVFIDLTIATSNSELNKSAIKLLIDDRNPLFKAPIKELKIWAHLAHFDSLQILVMQLLKHRPAQLSILILRLLVDSKDDLVHVEELIGTVEHSSAYQLKMVTEESESIELIYEDVTQLGWKMPDACAW